MSAAVGDERRLAPGRWRRAACRAVTVVAFLCPASSHSQSASAVRPAAVAPVVATSVASAPVASTSQWQALTPAQRQFLQPLEHDWPRLDPQQQRKWLVLSARAPKMSTDERQRIQARMTEWATFTPEQRGQARLRYQAARRFPAQDRQARWDAYQSLPPEQKQQLAARALLAPDGTPRSTTGSAHVDRSGHEPVGKSNIVPNPAFAVPPRPIGPTLLQARPGATTTLITKPATPPSHQQTGMPKIAATPEFVNKATLLPHRGPQGAASHGSPAASSAETAPSP